MPSRIVAARFVLILTFVVTASTVMEAQAPQAVMNASGALNERRTREEIAKRVDAVRAQVDAAQRVPLLTEGSESETAARVSARLVAELGERVIAARDSGTAVFNARLTEYRRAAQSFDALRADPTFKSLTGDSATSQAFSPGQKQLLLSNVPALFYIGPAVNFTLGYNFSSASAGDVHSLELGTNLVGAAAGTIFDALGEDSLAKFLRENMGVSTGFPTHRGGKLTTSAGIALGEFEVGAVILYPTLSMTQVDTTDRRIPGEVRADSSQESWSIPALTVGVLTADNLLCFKAERCYPPVFVLGVTMPQYYPGNSFAAIGALFTDNRSKFRREGSWRFNAGVAIPLRALRKVD